MKILHCTWHQGCKSNIEDIIIEFGHLSETQFQVWDNYNIGHDRAEKIWNKYKDYYEQFDLIITSDTVPLSRIFLQNDHWKKKLIIWACNRADYADQGSNDCGFPDKEYYEILRNGITKSNVKIFSYTDFELEYMKKYRNISWNTETIKPIPFAKDGIVSDMFYGNIKKSNVFFIPPYHNDTILLNLKEKCNQLGIQAYGGRYNGIKDLEGVKGIIHNPYAWSTFALFENWAIGNVYFIPTKRFLFELQDGGNFFWSPPFPREFIECSEWYLPEHQELFIYFDNWNELKQLTNNTALISQKKEKILQFSASHKEKTLKQWKSAIEVWK